MSWSSMASPWHQRWHEVVRVGAGEECGASGCWRWNFSTAAGAWTSVWGSHILSECDHPTNLTRYHNLPPSEPGVKDLFNFVLLLIVNSDRTRLWRLQVLHNFIWDVGVDTGDRYNRVDVLLPCREMEFDSSWGDDLGNGERTSPLVV